MLTADYALILVIGTVRGRLSNNNRFIMTVPLTLMVGTRCLSSLSWIYIHKRECVKTVLAVFEALYAPARRKNLSHPSPLHMGWGVPIKRRKEFRDASQVPWCSGRWVHMAPPVLSLHWKVGEILPVMDDSIPYLLSARVAQVSFPRLPARFVWPFFAFGFPKISTFKVCIKTVSPGVVLPLQLGLLNSRT